MLAYNQHHHLQIRPEDVWFAIVSQLCFYINRHAEDLREKFVAHKGKKELTVQFKNCDRYTVDFGLFAQRISYLIQENVLDPELREWVMPAFSTTTEHDNVVAAILLIGATQSYFSFSVSLLAGSQALLFWGRQKTGS